MDEMTELEWAYFAGIMDGEGNIGVYQCRMKSGKIRFSMGFNVGINSAELVAWLVNTVGGAFYPKKIDSIRHAQTYTWCLRQPNDVKRACIGVLPYLVIKKEQARLLMKFPVSNAKFGTGNFKGSTSFNASVHGDKMELYRKTLELNRRGPKVA